jgi:CHRD domain
MSRSERGLRPSRAAILPIALVFSLVVVFGTASPALAVFAELTADLSGDQEVPPTGSLAAGSVDLTIDTDKGGPGEQLCFDMTVEDLGGPAMAAHIHYGPAGTAPPNNIVVTLMVDDTGSAEQACAADADFNLANSCAPTVVGLLEDMSVNAQNYYINVHTAAFPAGEIRGQLSNELADPADPEAAPDPEEEPAAAAPTGCSAIPPPPAAPGPAPMPMPMSQLEALAAQASVTTAALLQILQAMSAAGVPYADVSVSTVLWWQAQMEAMYVQMISMGF